MKDQGDGRWLVGIEGEVGRWMFRISRRDWRVQMRGGRGRDHYSRLYLYSMMDCDRCDRSY